MANSRFDVSDAIPLEETLVVEVHLLGHVVIVLRLAEESLLVDPSSSGLLAGDLFDDLSPLLDGDDLGAGVNSLAYDC
jgi:hypothetical protein